MNRTSIEYPWLKDNEILYYDDVKEVYHYEMTNSAGIHRFYISVKMDPRQMSRELIDEYASVLGIDDTPEEAPAIREQCIEYDPVRDCMIVHDGCGNETIHQLPENPGDLHTISIKDFPKDEGYSLDRSFKRWRETLFSFPTSFDQREYLNVAGYDKIIITDDMLVVYTGEEYEMIKIPEYDWHWQLIMSEELIDLLKIHRQKAG